MDQETADTEYVPDSQLRRIQHNIQVQRKEQQMVSVHKRSHLEHVPSKPGDNVTIPIPFVDRGKGDHRNIMGVIVDREGILKGCYSRNQFDLCTQQLHSVEDISRDYEVGLRQAVQSESRCGGQCQMQLCTQWQTMSDKPV